MTKHCTAIFIVLVLFGSVVGCTSTHVIHSQSIVDLTSGSPVKSPVAVGVSSVPLPAGDWIVLGHAIAMERKRKRMQMYWYQLPISVTFLGEVVGNELGEKELRRLVLIAANQTADPGWGGLGQ